jgi:hypothetical protein
VSRAGRAARAGLALWLAWAAGCRPAPGPAPYEDGKGFRITPPPGWVERARSDAPAATHARSAHQPELPLPPLGGAGGPRGERLLVRYDRLTAGRLAWLRVSACEAPEGADLATFLAAPGPAWKRQGQPEGLELAGGKAARMAFAGRYDSQDYLCETVAVRHGGQVYLITASFPAADGEAREQVRRAVAEASWE